MKTIVCSMQECNEKAAEQIRQLLEKKPDAALALCAGRTPAGLYGELQRLCGEGRLSLKQAKVFAVTEFEGAPEEKSCRRMLEEALLEKTDLQRENCRFLNADTAETYEAEIQAVGGLDLAILGLGDNAHFGYNEPATPFDSRTHRQKLTDATRRQLAPVFGSAEATPEYAWTMGIKTLVSAREILVLAFGEEKADAAFKMLYARDDSVVPAAFLQIPLNVTVYLDQAAAAKI